MDIDFGRLKDFRYYANNFLKIKTEPPNAQILPFRLNPIQIKLDSLVERLLKEKGKAEIIILKARREGLSTYVEGRLFHETATTPNVGAFIIAHDKDGLDKIFNMSKLFYDELPTEIRPMKQYSSKKELVFANPNDKERLIEPGLRSSIEVFSANKGTASRSGGYHAAHFSEVAFYADAETLLTAVVSSTENAKFVFWESTANGRGDFFHNEWLNAKKGESVNTPIFFSWLEFPDYQEPLPNPQARKNLLHSLDEEEQMLVGKYHASPEQLYWRRRIIMRMQNDVDKFHQEYPVDDIEAFVASGNSYFPRTKLRELLNRTVEPIWVGELTGMGLTQSDDGELWIWEHPTKGCDYVIGVDSCEGTEDGDPAAMQVLKVPRGGMPIIEQVAEWHGSLDPVSLGKYSVLLARLYNEALLVPEINNHGHTTLNEIKENYFNVYFWQYFDRFGKTYSKKLGWETNISTRPLLCDYTLACINADVLILRSEELVDEMMNFIRRPTYMNAGGDAESGKHDDLLMAFMIALFCLAHSELDSGSLLKNLGSFGKSDDIIIDSKPGKILTFKSRTNIDESFLPPEEGDYYTGDQAWLNY